MYRAGLKRARAAWCWKLGPLLLGFGAGLKRARAAQAEERRLHAESERIRKEEEKRRREEDSAKQREEEERQREEERIRRVEEQKAYEERMRQRDEAEREAIRAVKEQPGDPANDNIIAGAGQAEDLFLDQTLRPMRFDDFVGQERVKENLRIYIEAARRRKEPLDHILFSGPPGLGKTTLATIIAHEMGADLKETSGPLIKYAGDLAGLLSKLDEGNLLFIDEIHRISATVEEYLYSAMEDYHIDIMLDQGPSARSVRVSLPRFTLVGSTTREGLLSAPFRSRFGMIERLDYYPPEDLFHIALNSAKALGMRIEEGGARVIAKRSRGTPRLVNRFLRRLRDMAEVLADGVVTEKVAHEGLDRLGVDARGLSEMDRRILETILRHGGSAVGAKIISVTVGEKETTIEDVYEPYLIQLGYIERTPRGRVPTDKAIFEYGKEHSGDDRRGHEDEARREAEEQRRHWERRKAEEERNRREEEARREKAQWEEQARREAEEQRKRSEKDHHREAEQAPIKDERYYGSVLGLKGKVTPADVRRRYYELASQYHPDKVHLLGPKLRELAEIEMKAINEAYRHFKSKYNL